MIRFWSKHFCLVGALALLVTLPSSAGEKLTLRINDTVGVPGGKAAIVLRTYASRPIEQGQMCIEARPSTPAPSGPVASAPSAEVYSANQDAALTFTSDLSAAVQTFVVQFNSPTATVNSADGPLAVVFVDLAETLVPGQSFDISIDLQNTFFIDENGRPIEIRPRAGTLTIRDPLIAVSLGVEAETVAPGEVAKISLNTSERIPLSSGRIGFVYDSAVAAGPPSVSVDPRYGQATFTLDTSTPGLAIVDFVSPDASLNDIPGNIIDLFVPTLANVPVGTQTPISINGSAFIVGADGQSPLLTLEGDYLSFVPTVMTSPGNVIDLRLGKSAAGSLELAWNHDCGNPDGFSIYRGDLALGYGSLTPIPWGCNVLGNTIQLHTGTTTGELFLVVPHKEELAGGYGRNANHDPRSPLLAACYPPASETITLMCPPTAE